MRARGLGDPVLVVADGAPGVLEAIETCFPRSARQRCLAHRMRTLAAKVPEDIRPEVKARIQAVYQAPSRAIRTTNLLERLFVEERRRLKIIPNAFGECLVPKLMFGAMTRAAERWRAIPFTEFERRRIEAVRKELADEYKSADTAPSAARQTQPITRFSSSAQT